MFAMALTIDTIVATVIIVAAWFVEPSKGKSIGINVLLLLFALFRWRPTETVLTFVLGVIFRTKALDFASNIANLSLATQAFIFLFIFKFLKVIVHTVSYLSYRAPKRPQHPTYTSSHCTVILPTVGDMGDEFVETIKSIMGCYPGGIIVSTVGEERLQKAVRVCSKINPDILCIAVDRPSKRNQFIAAVTRVATPLVVSADDHVFWPPSFLDSAVVPFEDPHVGIVGTVKRVRRQKTGSSFPDFLNLIACLYLERHNFECTASYNVDGGIFVVSGRTALYRTSILQSETFQNRYLNEHCFFGKSGPLNVDDDNFITRWMVKHGHKTVFLNTPHALMGTTLGVTGGWCKFRAQMARWARTTWRSNTITLFEDRTAWRTQPWCVYAVYFSAFVNFALFYDPALIMTLYYSSFHSQWAMAGLIGLLLFSKLIKPLPHYMRHPEDLAYLPAVIMFGYYHSWVKLHALFTCTNVSWGSRNLVNEPIGLQ